ncbi:MAG: hypothetical protein IKF51_07230 [Solobacterium sp.]|nr:hypothetical protein [Solobacterium sp.]
MLGNVGVFMHDEVEGLFDVVGAFTAWYNEPVVNEPVPAFRVTEVPFRVHQRHIRVVFRHERRIEDRLQHLLTDLRMFWVPHPVSTQEIVNNIILPVVTCRIDIGIVSRIVRKAVGRKNNFLNIRFIGTGTFGILCRSPGRIFTDFCLDFLLIRYLEGEARRMLFCGWIVDWRYFFLRTSAQHQREYFRNHKQFPDHWCILRFLSS